MTLHPPDQTFVGVIRQVLISQNPLDFIPSRIYSFLYRSDSFSTRTQ